MNTSIDTPNSSFEPLKPSLIEEEARFYNSYHPWALNVFATIGNTFERIRNEFSMLGQTRTDWQREEIVSNIFLLASAISDVVDDYLIGKVHDFSKVRNVFPVLSIPVQVLEKGFATRRQIRSWRIASLHQWRKDWGNVLVDFLRESIAGGVESRQSAQEVQARFVGLTSAKFPTELLKLRIRNPAAFRTQDLTGADIFKLGQKFRAQFNDRQRPILVVGSRTAGSYFAPLLHAYLSSEGYSDVSSMTLRPKKGASSSEEAEIRAAAAKNAVVALIDEPPYSGSALQKCVDIFLKYGTQKKNVALLFPVHPSHREWQGSQLFVALDDVPKFALDPEEYEKYSLLAPEKVEARLREYFQSQGFQDVKIIPSAAADEYNAYMESLSEKKFHARLKRCYEVSFRDSSGGSARRFIIAKSVGWGWLSYHAFLAGQRLQDSVPTLLGLRDGILYSEFIPGITREIFTGNRSRVINLVASYVAKRVQTLRMPDDPTVELCSGTGHNGFEYLAEVLSQAYGYKATAGLKRATVLSEISRLRCPVPTLVDSRMRSIEWVDNGSTLVKTDYEQHGQGKIAQNIADPAYDLAEVIMYFKLSEPEEKELLSIYAVKSGDSQIQQRIYFYKLLAGTWCMNNAIQNLEDARLASRHQEFSQEYLDAWNFCMIHTARFCAQYSKPFADRASQSPLVFLDVDGVLDKQIFGFPSNTAAGIQAIALLHSHGVPVVLNTARSPMEVKEYCQAYGFLGGVGEYGAFAWDAVTGREKVMLSQECLDEIELVRAALRKIPGVFLNEHYKYSIKAFTYSGGRTVPLPKLMVAELLDRLGVKTLAIHPTYTDTCIIAKEVNKGTGIKAMLKLMGQENAEVIAVGDTEPDLAAFRVAKKSFAPSNCTCRPAAKSMGCHIVSASYTNGLLEIVKEIVHPDGGHCSHCKQPAAPQGVWDQYFMNLLRISDRPWPKLLVRSMLSSESFRAFIR